MTHPGLSILPGPVMAARTTLGVGGQTLAEIQVHAPEAAPEAYRAAASLGGRLLALGGGSNILAGPGQLDVVVLHLAGAREPKIVREEENSVLVRADSSVKLPVLLRRLGEWGLSGLEGLAGVPGEVGGAVAMNAGSYGHEMGGALEKVLLFRPSEGVREYGREELDIRYRHFAPKAGEEPFLVLAATFRLQKSGREAVEARMRANLAAKRGTQPVGDRSAGCVFKNPSSETPAGKLLDSAGCKGMAVGGMAVSERHANFMVNRGVGTADEALELLELMAERVSEAHGIQLEPEVVIWR